MQQSRGAAAEETPPANHIHPEAAKVAFEIEFPVVEGYQDPGIVKVEVDWAGLRMPVENDNITVSNRKFFCVDPSDGTAIFEFAKPRAAGLVQISDDRETICVGTLPVDPNERPLLERLECEMRIDHDYVAHVTLRSQGRQENSQLEFHQLDFGLTLPTDFGRGNGPDQDDTHSPDNGERVDGEQSKRSSTLSAALQSNITLRSNLVPTDDHSRATTADWRMVPGDLVERWRTDFLGPRLSELSQMQMDERNYYLPCVR
jgi:molecular chaperone DnaK